MSKIAVIKSGGKQYKVKEGQIVSLEKIDKKEGAKVSFDTLLIASTDAKEVNVGKPGPSKQMQVNILIFS